ncbi:MAG TPA: response regulator transcription factor [Solirubrobacteraceae bacterium]|nr:response regulator transcription factor [Solirubrobacteraceae bacterium]
MILIAADPALWVRIERALAAAPVASAVVTADVTRLDASRAAHPGAAVLVVGVRRSQVAAVLDGGADAVIAGPLRPAELRARVRALERRDERSWTVGPLAIDTRAHSVQLDGAKLSLPRREFALLRCLASAPGCLFTKAELLSSCWDASAASPRSRTLERHAARLRRRLGRHGSMLVTVWGIGYRLDEPA